MSASGNSLAVVTPSYAPDLELFADLHQSVLDHTSEMTVHHVIVPPSDVPLFSRFASERCRVWLYSELLPPRYRRLPRRAWWVDLRRPWPPVRGWVLQQALKLALCARLEVDAAIVADSDVVLVRPVDHGRLTGPGGVARFRVEDAVHAAMDRHLLWHAAARSLLGLSPSPPPPLPDYVSSLNVWSPEVLRAMLSRVEHATGRTWLDAFTRELHISEFVLYGVFIDEVWVEENGAVPSAGTLSHDYWDREPMDVAAAAAFADRLPPDAVGMMISSKSGTPGAVRRAAIARCAAVVQKGPLPGPGSRQAALGQ